MLKSTLELLACPACRVALHTGSAQHSGSRLMSGVLSCPHCALQVPVTEGFALFTCTAPGTLPESAKEQLGASAAYRSFVHQRHTRRLPDRYAAFQPFNESTRAFYALLDLIRPRLKPGDAILDTWGRTGWSGEMLAAAFPEQHIVSIWEGNFDVLGYAGYAHWLPAARRAPNHDVIFVAPGGGLPFLDHAFALVHGLDSLHRYAASMFAGEVLRVTRADGVIVFPHVHLSNSEPTPFFERGGNIVPGRSYQQRFEQAAARAGRSVVVMAEAVLFAGGERLRSDPETPHYNALVALVPPAFDGAPLRSANLDLCLPHARAVFNPLLRVDSLDGSAAPDPHAFGGLTEELLLRHPCYAQRLAALGMQRLDATQLRILFQLSQLLTLEETAQRLAMPFETVALLVGRMVTQEMLQVAPLSGAMHQLQSYYSDQIVRPLPRESNFEYLWRLLPDLYGDKPLLVSGADDSAFGWDEVQLLVPALQRGLLALGVKAGDRVAMLSAPHPEAMLLTWAIWRNGSVLVPLRKELAENPTELTELLQRIAPALVILDRPRAAAAALSAAPILLLDDCAGDAGDALPGEPQLAHLLPDWLDLPAAATPAVAPDDPAVILFTSGSTGQPKGVVLSQRALLLSGQLAATEFGWHDKDVLLSLGEQHTMSGLRNPALAALFAGATVYLPSAAQRAHPGATLQAAAEHGVTLLAAGPAWLALLDRLAPHLTCHPSALRQIVTTGATLPSALHAAVCARMRVQIVDYFGLTETGGLCLVFEHDGGAAACGRPAGALLQICDYDDQPVAPGIAGQLRVHSNQLLSAYWGDQAGSALRGGWFYTGDIASHDGQGRIVLLGRRDDQLKNEFGEVVHPAPLERLLAGHPHVRDAALVQGPHGLVSLLVTDAGFDLPDFANWCRSRSAGTYLPRAVVQVAALPQTAAGKLDRRRLAALL